MQNRTVIFATAKNLVVKNMMFPSQNNHKHTWNYTDGKALNQIDHVLMYRRWHLCVLHVRTFRGADCDTDQYLVVAKFRKSLAVNKQATRKFDEEELNGLEVRKLYKIELTNRFAVLGNWSDGKYINKKNFKTSPQDSLGMYELKQPESWFYEECLSFLDQRKQAKMNWVQFPS
jgi:hypothetical protein